jgi:hypothetical protein
MTVSLTAATLQQGLTALTDVVTALQDHLLNIDADEAVVSDGLAIATVFDPALIPFAMALPAAEFLVALLIANNTQGQPGSQTPSISGKKGSDPWET